MFESVFVYSLLTVVMVICGYFASQREPAYNGYSGVFTKNSHFLRPEIIICILAFALVFGCRYNVGIDYPKYRYHYIFGTGERYEFLFSALSDICSYIGFHYAFFFALCAFCQIYMLLYALRRYRFIFPYLLFFLIFGYYYMSMMNVIRQQIAAMIFLCSLEFIEKKQIVWYYLCVLLAVGFHSSAIVLVVFYPLLCYRQDWFTNLPLQLVLLAIAVYFSFRYDLIVTWVERPFRFFTSLLGYDRYSAGILTNERLNSIAQFGANTGYGMIVSLLKVLPIIIFSKDLKAYYNSSLFNMFYTLFFIRVLADYFFGSSIILNRPFVYVSNINLVVLAFFVYYCFRSKSIIKKLCAVFLILLNMFMFLYILSNGSMNTSEFHFFWEAGLLM